MRTIHLVRFGIVLACCAVGCVSLQEMEQARRQQEASVWTSQCAVRLEEYWNNIAENNAVLALSALDDTEYRYEEKIREIEAHLRDWLAPRIESLSRDDALKGDALLEEFGTKYMPNAYANYEKVRDSAKLCQNVINENFKKLYGCRDGNLCSAIKEFSKARVQYFRRHDELCHYYLVHKAGGLSAEQLSEIDKKPISIFLLEPLNQALFMPEVSPENEKTISFINKQMPDVALYITKLEEKRNELNKMRCQLMADARLLDYDRYDLAIMACIEGVYAANAKLYFIFACADSFQMKHAMMNITAAELQELDKQYAQVVRSVCVALERYVERRSGGRLFGRDEMMEKHYTLKFVHGWQFDSIGLYRNSYRVSGPFDVDIRTGLSPHIYVGGVPYDKHSVFFMRKKSPIKEFKAEDLPRYVDYFPRDFEEAAIKDERSVVPARYYIEHNGYANGNHIMSYSSGTNRFREFVNVSEGKCWVARDLGMAECLCSAGVCSDDNFRMWTQNGHPQRSIFEIRASEVDGVYYASTVSCKKKDVWKIELNEMKVAEAKK